MSNFFEYNFSALPNNQINTLGGGLSSGTTGYAFDNENMKPKTPESHFFISPTLAATNNIKAFGPLNDNEFQITTIFNSASSIEAYAVTSGTLFFAQYGDSLDRVNIFLKPNKDIGLGVKIKYFVYRGVKTENIFKKVGNETFLIEKLNTNILDFLKPVWDDYVEFNLTDQDFKSNEVGYLDINTTANQILQMFFTKDKHSLLHVKAGTHIGNFEGNFGFDIVLDEGDFSQDNPDTDLIFNEKFATAKECILKVDGPHPVSSPFIFGANSADNIVNGSINNEKVFRESIYHFIDPAAYYGAHITDSSNNNDKGGNIKIKNGVVETSLKESLSIYNEIISKFKNKNKIYIYIKSTRGRSYKFYKNESERTINIFGANVPFNTNKWPLLIRSVFSNTTAIDIEFNKNNIIYSNIILKKSGGSESGYLLGKVGNFLLSLPIVNTNQNVSCFIYLNYFDGNEVSNNLFGNVNLKSIFEREDFTSKQGSFVNHFRPVLIKERNEIGMYNTKVILHGNYIADTNPSNTAPTPAELAQNLRTYILFPQKSTNEKTGVKRNKLTAGYYSTKDMEEYMSAIYDGGEIWRGIIKETSGYINSLLYRTKDNDDSLSIYQLGISQLDYDILINGIDNNATNLFFVFEHETPYHNISFLKYDLKIKYDKQNGTTEISTTSIPIYTIDGCFFFTKEYSTNFKSEYCKEFAETTVEFRPHQDWDGEFGIDWYRKGQTTWLNDPYGNKIYDKGFAGNVGTIPTQNDGNDYSGAFVPDNMMLFQLKRKEYNVYPTTWALADDETECFTSWLSLNKGKTAKLNLRIRVKKEAAKLRIRYPNKYFKKIDTLKDYLDPADGNFNFYDFPVNQKQASTIANFYDLEITCIEEFISTEILKVMADDKLAGMLKVLPNKKNVIDGQQNFLFVNVKFKLPDGNICEYPTAELSNQKNYLEKFIHQSQIIPNIEMTANSLDLTSDKHFNKIYTGTSGGAGGEGYYAYTNPLHTPGDPSEPKYEVRAYFSSNSNSLAPSDFIDIKQYLRSKLLSAYPEEYNKSKYNSYIFIFFLYAKGGEESTATFKNINGYSSGKQTDIAVFRLDLSGGSWIGHIDETLSHEAYHSLGIPHAFDRLDENSIYVYKYGQTDNLLDYTHNNSRNRRSLYHWQWIIAKNNIKK